MNTRAHVIGVLGLLAAATTPALVEAQGVRPNTSEVHAYGGWMKGDDITSEQVSGRTPKMESHATFGLRYDYNFNQWWGIDLSGGYTRTHAKDLPEGNIKLDLITVDVDALFHMNPKGPFVGYLVLGAGYIDVSLDHEITGLVGTTPTIIHDKNSWTANGGIGAKWFLTDNFMLRGEARYRYIDKMVENFEKRMNTYEATLGIGWRF